MDKELYETFKRRRRFQVLITIPIMLPAWYFGAGRNLAASLIVTAIVAILRWHYFSKNLM